MEVNWGHVSFSLWKPSRQETTKTRIISGIGWENLEDQNSSENWVWGRIFGLILLNWEMKAESCTVSKVQSTLRIYYYYYIYILFFFRPRLSLPGLGPACVGCHSGHSGHRDNDSAHWAFNDVQLEKSVTNSHSLWRYLATPIQWSQKMEY